MPNTDTPSQKPTQRPLAIITGASSGIGWSYAQEFARRGYDLSLCARRLNRLEELKQDLAKYKVDIHIKKVDLLERNQRSDFFNEVKREFPNHFSSTTSAETILVNNAGFGTVSKFSEVEIEKERNMITLNCEALVELSYLAFMEMKKLKKGTIINVASIAAYPPMCYMTTYGATKAFVRSFSLALLAEAKQFGVHVMTHCPGPTQSEFHIVSGLSQKMDHIPSMTSLEVVKQAINSAEKRRSVCINGVGNKFLSLIGKIFPGALASQVVEKILRAEVSKK